MVRPAMLWPSRLSSAATVELSTPPDMATAMRSDMLRRGLPGVLSDDRWRYAAQVHDAGLDCLDQAIDLFFRVLWPQREAHAGAGFLRRQAHGEKNVRRLDGAARTG